MIQLHAGMNLLRTFLQVLLVASFCLVQAGVVHSQVAPPPPPKMTMPMPMPMPPIVPQIPKPSTQMPQMSPQAVDPTMKPQLSAPTPIATPNPAP